MIGTGHENLMLPAPSRRHRRDRAQASAAGQRRAFANAAMVYQAQGQPGDQSNKDGHLEWLKQLNARAKAANHNPMTQPPGQPASMMPPPGTLVSMHAPPQPPTVVAQHGGGAAHVFHAGTFPTAAAAAAAVAQNPMLYQAALNHKFHMAAQSQGESEEKRARRLERNRESARKSRRRKKERLATLGAQVDRLHTQIEDERRNQVNAMCATLKQVRKDELARLLHDDQLNTQAGQERIASILMCSSGGSPIARSATEFQYTTLRQVLLPRYQKFLLWLTLHGESFFTAGKDEYTRKDGKQVRSRSSWVAQRRLGYKIGGGLSHLTLFCLPFLRFYGFLLDASAQSRLVMN